jgi:predicted methyltransferase
MLEEGSRMTARFHRRSLLALAGAAGLCTAARPLRAAPTPAAVAPRIVHKDQIKTPDALRQAMASPRRPAADKKRDAGRKPAETMAFYGITPGMTVAELMTSSGYFTAVLAEAVGETGRVYGQNSKWLRDRFKDTNRPLGELITKGGYANIIEVNTELETLDLPPAGLDAVFIVMFYHDLYWLGVDRPAMNKGVMAALKPGGIYGIIDHHAAPGMEIRDVARNHRIEKYVVVEDVLKAGFELIEETDLLENPKDPLNVSVFQQELRGFTHQFVLKFRKPPA